MELVSIIYNSLFVVFSLLSVILLISFLSSKVISPSVRLKSGDNNAKHKNTQLEIDKSKVISPNKMKKTEYSTKPNVNDKSGARIYSIAPKANKQNRYQVNEGLIEANKIRVVRSESRKQKPIKRTFHNNDISRYAVVNANVKESRGSADLYAKFSKLSVEYSQTM